MKKVLVINDENDTNLLIKLALEDKGYTIAYTHHLKEGKALFLTFMPQLLLLDINLPDGNGLDHIIYFKEKGPSAKICMISANEDIERSYDFKADAFLSKPFSLSQIMEKTKELIG